MICVRSTPANTQEHPLTYHYCLADCRVGSDASLDALEPFRVEGVCAEAPVIAPANPDSFHEVFADTGWIAGEERRVICRRSGVSYQLEIADVARFEIATGDPALIRVQPDDRAAPPLIEEALLGPALNLALAWRGIWCLHAGAVLHDGQVIVFLGESGSGKSTLAALLADLDRQSWRRVADDVLPVRVTSTGLQALPHFPQLKLPADEQPGYAMPGRIAIRAVYLLSDENVAGQVATHRLTPREGALALIRHTIASRLFDGPLLEQHLSAGMEAARVVPVSRLVYPRSFDVAPRVAEALATDWQSILERNPSS